MLRNKSYNVIFSYFVFQLFILPQQYTLFNIINVSVNASGLTAEVAPIIPLREAYLECMLYCDFLDLFICIQ